MGDPGSTGGGGTWEQLRRKMSPPALPSRPCLLPMPAPQPQCERRLSVVDGDFFPLPLLPFMCFSLDTSLRRRRVINTHLHSFSLLRRMGYPHCLKEAQPGSREGVDGRLPVCIPGLLLGFYSDLCT